MPIAATLCSRPLALAATGAILTHLAIGAACAIDERNKPLLKLFRTRLLK